MALPGGISGLDLFGGAMMLLGSVVLAVSARYVWRASAVYRATERETLSGADDGSLVRVTGEATNPADDPLVAPFSGEECVALRYSVEERRLSTLYVFPWDVTVHEAEGSVAFDVGTGEAIPVVAPARTVTLTTDVVATVGLDEEPPDRVARFERETGGVTRSTPWREPPGIVAPLFRVLSLGTRRYSEQRATVGDKVTVVGHVDDDGSGIDPLVVSDRSPLGTVVRMAKTSLVGLLIGLLVVPFGYLLSVGL